MSFPTDPSDSEKSKPPPKPTSRSVYARPPAPTSKSTELNAQNVPPIPVAPSSPGGVMRITEDFDYEIDCDPRPVAAPPPSPNTSPQWAKPDSKGWSDHTELAPPPDFDEEGDEGGTDPEDLVPSEEDV